MPVAYVDTDVRLATLEAIRASSCETQGKCDSTCEHTQASGGENVRGGYNTECSNTNSDRQRNNDNTTQLILRLLHLLPRGPLLVCGLLGLGLRFWLRLRRLVHVHRVVALLLGLGLRPRRSLLGFVLVLRVALRGLALLRGRGLRLLLSLALLDEITVATRV